MSRLQLLFSNKNQNSFLIGVGLAITACCLSVPAALAAPMPVSSTSQVVKELAGKWFSEKGFSIDFSQSKWKLVPKPKGFDNIETVFQGSNEHGSQAALTIRVDELAENQNFKKYVLKSLKDFPRFGFDILESQPIQLNQDQAFIIDLFNRNSNKQLRQILVAQNKKVAILTCRDDQRSFKQSLNECNKIVSSFKWIKK